MKKTNKIKTGILAGILSTITIFSVGAISFHISKINSSLKFFSENERRKSSCVL